MLSCRREAREIAVDVAACRTAVAAALAPKLSVWTSKDAEIVRALDEARARWLGGAASELGPLADAIVSLAVAWVGLSARSEVEGPGASGVQYDNVARLIDLWVAERGLPHALEALVASVALDQNVDPQSVERADLAYATLNGARAPSRWRRLREHVAAASEADYAAVRARAERLRADATPFARAFVTFVFPWESAWALADAKLRAASRFMLLGTALDVRTYRVIIDDSSWDAAAAVDDGRCAAMFEILGDDAEEPALAVLESWRHDDLSLAASVAARFATPKVAAAMSKLLHRREAPVAREFFRRNPKLALDTLLGERGPDVKALIASAVARDHEAACARAKRTRTKAHKKLLEELGATDAWVGARPPKRVADAAKRWKEVAAWVAAGAPWSGRSALAVIAEPEALVAFIKAAAVEALPIALAAVDVLATHDDALLYVARLADGAVRREVAEHCRGHLDGLRAKKHLTEDDVEDLVAPSFAHGMLDYGALKLVARFDESFKPVLYDTTGERVASVPRATKGGVAARASELWAAMRDAPEEAKIQARRMEDEMNAGRSFPDAIFRERVVPHPVLGAIARKLLWRDGAGVLFRIEDDGSFANVDDVSVRVSAPFHIAPVETLTDDEHARWSDVFASYKILQPFKQL